MPCFNTSSIVLRQPRHPQRLPEARANSLQQEKGGGQKNQWDVLCQVFSHRIQWCFHVFSTNELHQSHIINTFLTCVFWVFALNPEWMLINVLRVARCYHLVVFFSGISHTSSILDDKYEGNWCPNCVSQGEQKLPGLSGGIRVSQPVEWWTKTRRRIARSNSWEVEGVSRKLLGKTAARLNTQLLLFRLHRDAERILKMEGFEKRGGSFQRRSFFDVVCCFLQVRPLVASGKMILVIWVSYLFVGKGKWSTANQKDIYCKHFNIEPVRFLSGCRVSLPRPTKTLCCNITGRYASTRYQIVMLSERSIQHRPCKIRALKWYLAWRSYRFVKYHNKNRLWTTWDDMGWPVLLPRSAFGSPRADHWWMWILWKTSGHSAHREGIPRIQEHQRRIAEGLWVLEILSYWMPMHDTDTSYTTNTD